VRQKTPCTFRQYFSATTIIIIKSVGVTLYVSNIVAASVTLSPQTLRIICISSLASFNSSFREFVCSYIDSPSSHRQDRNIMKVSHLFYTNTMDTTVRRIMDILCITVMKVLHSLVVQMGYDMRVVKGEAEKLMDFQVSFYYYNIVCSW